VIFDFVVLRLRFCIQLRTMLGKQVRSWARTVADGRVLGDTPPPPIATLRRTTRGLRDDVTAPSASATSRQASSQLKTCIMQHATYARAECTSRGAWAAHASLCHS
jgi:hypothetical protein